MDSKYRYVHFNGIWRGVSTLPNQSILVIFAENFIHVELNKDVWFN